MIVQMFLLILDSQDGSGKRESNLKALRRALKQIYMSLSTWHKFHSRFLLSSSSQQFSLATEFSCFSSDCLNRWHVAMSKKFLRLSVHEITRSETRSKVNRDYLLKLLKTYKFSFEPKVFVEQDEALLKLTMWLSKMSHWIFIFKRWIN